MNILKHESEAFHTILIDPPWPETGGGRIKRGADRHYALLKVREIVPVIIDSGVFRPDDHAHLYLWVTNTHVEDGLNVIRELGFRYITALTWAKPGFGIGQYFRGQTEHLLFATRGKGLELRRAWTSRRDIPTLITADWVRDNCGKRIHSGKPNEAYELVEAASPPPRLEMFARQPRQGWTTWGNELPQAAMDDEVAGGSLSLIDRRRSTT